MPAAIITTANPTNCFSEIFVLNNDRAPFGLAGQMPFVHSVVSVLYRIISVGFMHGKKNVTQNRNCQGDPPLQRFILKTHSPSATFVLRHRNMNLHPRVAARIRLALIKPECLNQFERAHFFLLHYSHYPVHNRHTINYSRNAFSGFCHKGSEKM